MARPGTREVAHRCPARRPAHLDRLSGRGLLRHTGLLHGVDVIDVARRSDQLLDALGLDEAADKIVADYSAGMTQKIGLACALIHAPRVWARGSSSRR